MRKVRSLYVVFAVLAAGLAAVLALQGSTLNKVLATALILNGQDVNATEEANDTERVTVRRVTRTELTYRAAVGIAQGKVIGGSLPGLLPESAVQSNTITRRLHQGIKGLKPMPLQELRSIDSETLWLARGIYSETKQPEEQELVAWVIRNRVETGYRGKRTYQEVVLDPYQFSAFNPESSVRTFYSSLTPEAKYPGWQMALTIAHRVKNMTVMVRPFSPETRHFYSEQSMVGRRHPEWASNLQPVTPLRDIELDPERFRFYEGIL